MEKSNHTKNILNSEEMNELVNNIFWIKEEGGAHGTLQIQTY